VLKATVAGGSVGLKPLMTSSVSPTTRMKQELRSDLNQTSTWSIGLSNIYKLYIILRISVQCEASFHADGETGETDIITTLVVSFPVLLRKRLKMENCVILIIKPHLLRELKIYTNMFGLPNYLGKV
jgi:hypothetical protein